MGWFKLLLLSLILLIPISSSGKDVKACIIDSYNIEITRQIKEKLEERLSGGIENIKFTKNQKECEVKILIGTPAVMKALKENDNKSKKIVYSFVLFPEALKLQTKKNFYGVRIFPLPTKTIKVFFRYTGERKAKVAVPISSKTLPIARLYLSSNQFKILPYKSRIEELYPKLKNYKYIYIFPDPQTLKIVNLLNLVRFAKGHKQILISGLPDLERYEINFIYAVDYDKLVDKLISLIKDTPKKKILPCPARVKVWSH